MSEARSAESMGNGWAGSSFGRTLGALALALMLIVSPGPGALPAFADPAVADPVPAVAPAAVADGPLVAEMVITMANSASAQIFGDAMDFQFRLVSKKCGLQTTFFPS